MGPQKPVTWHQYEGVPVIAIHGDFSDDVEDDIVAVHEEIRQLKSDRHIILHFDEEAHIYSSGMAVLVDCLISSAEERGQVIHVVGLSEHFADVFEFTGLTRYVVLSSSEQEALTAIRTVAE